MKAEWRTSDVLALCAGMREARDYSAAPILADALQDAGCDDEPLLATLRENASRVLTERAVAVVYSDETANAVKWIEQYCVDLGPAGYPNYEQHAENLDYEMLMDGAHRYAETGDALFDSMNWSNASMDAEYQTFLNLFHVVTGAPLDDPNGNLFACEC